jgi:hypothetical protein
MFLFKIFEHMRFQPYRKTMQEVPSVLEKPGFWPPDTKRYPLIDLFLFSVVSNLASYAITFTAPYVLGLFILMIKR